MPCNGNKVLQNRRARILVIGEPKTQKTWWALAAAEAGYNVFYIDGDNSLWDIPLKNNAWDRINSLNANNSLGTPVFKNVIDTLVRQGNTDILWDLQGQCTAPISDPARDYIRIRRGLFTSDDVVIIDSWSALTWSVRLDFCLANGIDLADAAKPDWPSYMYETNFANNVLDWLSKSLGAHVIVICHQVMHDHRAPPKAGEKVGPVLWSKLFPVASSANAAQQLPGSFTDVLYFKRLTTSTLRINAVPSDGMLGCGSRTVPPSDYDWRNLQAKDFFEKISGPASGKPSEAVEYIPQGHDPIRPAAPVPLARRGAVQVNTGGMRLQMPGSH